MGDFITTAASDGTPEEAWALVSRPARWKEWAPHVRGAAGLGLPEVAVGSRGFVQILGVVPVPAVVTRKVPGRTWTWRVGPIEIDHRVRPRPEGRCAVEMELRGPAPIILAYAPVVALMNRNLARVAASA